MRPGPRRVLLDLDGTLVDSVYHHVVAWQRALAGRGVDVPAARIHAGVGMGADRLVPWLAGTHAVDVDAVAGDHLRIFRELAGGLRPTDGATALVEDLEGRDVPYTVATSAGHEERQVLLGALPVALDVVDADDVESSKPAPDLLLAACRALGTEPADAVMVGDSPWDARAAARVSMPCILVRCGGFGDDVLRDAGADQLVDAPRDLIGQL